MAFDAEAPAALAFVTTSGALDAYRLAKLANTPGAYRLAAHKLAAALEQARPTQVRPVLRVWVDGEGDSYRWGYEGGAFQFSGFSTAVAAREDALAAHPSAALCWTMAPEQAPNRTEARADSRATRKPRVAKVDGVDLAAPLANVPRAKQAVGAFVCRWADGSETRVQGVVYHVAKPDGRWAAAFQAANRLRRMRDSRELAKAERFAGRLTTGPCGVEIDVQAWRAFERARPMPALAEILCENTADVHTAEGVYGAGDAVEADRLGDELRRPPVRPAPILRAVQPVDTGPVVQLRPPHLIAQALSAVAAAEAAHKLASRAFAEAVRPTKQGAHRATPEAAGRAYQVECASFSALRIAQRELQALAA